MSRELLTVLFRTFFNTIALKVTINQSINQSIKSHASTNTNLNGVLLELEYIINIEKYQLGLLLNSYFRSSDALAQSSGLVRYLPVISPALPLPAAAALCV